MITQRGGKRPDQPGHHTLDVTPNAFTRASVAGRNEALGAPKAEQPELHFCTMFLTWSGSRDSHERAVQVRNEETIAFKAMVRVYWIKQLPKLRIKPP